MGNINWWIVAAAGVAAGLLDLVYAVVTVVLHGMPAIAVPLAVASGVLGPAAFHGGAGTVVLGLFLHLTILVVAAAIYLLAFRRIPVLRINPFVSGTVYGALLYLFMHAVVLPLSSAPPFKNTPGMTAMDIVMHVLVVGPVLALATKAARARESPVKR